MTKAEHKARHAELHKSFDELMADFIIQNPGRLPSNTKVIELMGWSFRQTQDPTVIKDGEHALGAQAIDMENPQDKIFQLELKVNELQEDNAMLTARLVEVMDK